MSDGLRRAEALLNNFELKIAADYGSTEGRHPSDVGQEIADAPEAVENPIVEAGELFYEGRGNAHSFADDEELDEAEKSFEKAFDRYEQALESHLDYNSTGDLVDVDLVIEQALGGSIEEEAVVEAAGLQPFVVDDLDSEQMYVRRNMDDEDAYEFLEESGYDTESVVRENYLQGIRNARESVEQGLAEIR
ncbi:MAG: hypothetical protein ABEK04_02315 [Candidatus Nanohalobium sp.]